MAPLHYLMKISYLVEDNIHNQDGTWVWMDELVMKLYDFRGIYRIFWSQNSHWIVKKLL